MSKKLGSLSQIFRDIRKSIQYAYQKTSLVGEDHLGNKYFFKEADQQKNQKESRYFEPQIKDLTQLPDIPTEWQAWLQYKRNSIPTQEEIDKNIALTMRTLQRAKDLDEKDNLEKEFPSSGTNALSLTSTVTSSQDQKKFPSRPGLELKPGSSESDKTTDR